MDCIRKLEQVLLSFCKNKKSINWDEFSLLAENELKRIKPNDPFKIISELIKSDTPKQNGSKKTFSDYPFTLINNNYFSIEYYFWTMRHTSIHQHHFAGAFKVIKGSSVHFEFNFENQINLEPWLKKGELKLKNKPKFLKENDTQKILPGNRYIHYVHHLENPTISLIIKSKPIDKLYDYIYPNYAWHDRYPSFESKKRLSFIAHYYRHHYNDLKKCQNLLKDFFDSTSTHDLYLLSYNYPVQPINHQLYNNFHNLLKNDHLRFSWYEDLIKHRDLNIESLKAMVEDYLIKSVK